MIIPNGSWLVIMLYNNLQSLTTRGFIAPMALSLTFYGTVESASCVDPGLEGKGQARASALTRRDLRA